MANNIEFAKRYTGILDEVYQRAAVSGCLDSGRNMVRAGRSAKEILIPKVEVTGLGNYTRNVGYKTGSITWSFETHTFGYDRAMRLFADVMDTDNVNAGGGIKNMLLNSGFSEVFSFSPSAMACAEPIVVTEGAFVRESHLAEEERGSIAVAVMVVRDVAADAEAVAGACERAVRSADWEPFAEAGSYRIVGIDTSAPVFKSRDSNGRYVWAFDVACTVVRSL